MGIDYSGGMIVGADAEDIDYEVRQFEYGYEFCEEHDMTSYSFWYDADESGQVWGYPVSDVNILSEEFDDWVGVVKRKAQKFEEITGVKVKLIGMQDIY